MEKNKKVQIERAAGQFEESGLFVCQAVREWTH